MAICMIVIPFLCHIGESTGFYTTSIVLVFYGVACGAAQSSTFMMGALFPFKYMSAIMLGNGISGFGSNVLRACTLWIWPASKDPDNAFRGVMAIYLFTFCIEVFCVIAQLYLNKNDYANYVLNKAKQEAKAANPRNSKVQRESASDLGENDGNRVNDSNRTEDGSNEKMSLSLYWK